MTLTEKMLAAILRNSAYTNAMLLKFLQGFDEVKIDREEWIILKKTIIKSHQDTEDFLKELFKDG